MNWLLLRGLAREQRHWNGFPATLERHLPGAKVFCLDLPGTGTEFTRASPRTIDGIVRDLRARFLALRELHAGPWGLFGISLGGMVTMRWGADFPGDFTHLVVANTSARNLAKPWERMDLRVVPKVALSAARREPLVRERSILGMTTNLVPDLDAVAREWARYADERPMRRTNVARQLVAAMRFRAPASLSVPLLVLSSAKDGFTSPNCPKRIAEHFRAPLVVHPDANHDLGNDAPEWTAAQIRDWLDRSGARAA